MASTLYAAIVLVLVVSANGGGLDDWLKQGLEGVGGVFESLTGIGKSDGKGNGKNNGKGKGQDRNEKGHEYGRPPTGDPGYRVHFSEKAIDYVGALAGEVSKDFLLNNDLPTKTVTGPTGIAMQISAMDVTAASYDGPSHLETDPHEENGKLVFTMEGIDVTMRAHFHATQASSSLNVEDDMTVTFQGARIEIDYVGGRDSNDLPTVTTLASNIDLGTFTVALDSSSTVLDAALDDLKTVAETTVKEVVVAVAEHIIDSHMVAVLGDAAPVYAIPNSQLTVDYGLTADPYVGQNHVKLQGLAETKWNGQVAIVDLVPLDEDGERDDKMINLFVSQHVMDTFAVHAHNSDFLDVGGSSDSVQVVSTVVPTIRFDNDLDKVTVHYEGDMTVNSNTDTVVIDAVLDLGTSPVVDGVLYFTVVFESFVLGAGIPDASPPHSTIEAAALALINNKLSGGVPMPVTDAVEFTNQVVSFGDNTLHISADFILDVDVPPMVAP